MLFNSLQFAIFFVVVYGFYLLLRHKWQNRMLLLASYIFYGAWDWRFLSLIFISTILDYFCGLRIYESNDQRKRKLFLFFSVFGNLAILGFFKYFNFFASNFQALLGYFGFSLQPRFLKIILPIGISFYTFQTMSYTIDIYRQQLKPTRKFFDFALFVAFFPQLVAGPIERARRLLPQILSSRRVTLDKFYEGCYLIFWGLFQKVFIADNLARVVNPVFASQPPYNGIKVLIALYAFAFQIFCDFAGYSNIARGLSKCMGFEIMINFRFPYFVTNPKAFWQRWHISLSTWLRDYLYISLGGNRKGAFKAYRNLLITMLLGGLWHGAAWTFVVWGAYQAMLLIIHRVFGPLFKREWLPQNAFVKNTWFLIKVVFFFHCICLGWLIFRAQSLGQIFAMLQALVFNFRMVSGLGIGVNLFTVVFVAWLLVIVQIMQFTKDDLMAVYKSNVLFKTAFYLICYFLLVTYGAGGGKEFIYFQF